MSAEIDIAGNYRYLIVSDVFFPKDEIKTEMDIEMEMKIETETERKREGEREREREVVKRLLVVSIVFGFSLHFTEFRPRCSQFPIPNSQALYWLVVVSK